VKGFAGYELGEQVGRGAWGTVFRARDASGREIALKLISTSLSGPKLERFEREGQLTACLRHPGIVQVHSCGVHEGQAFIAYELIEDARPLAEVEGDLATRCGLLRDTARALGHAHAHGILHRDVKSENVLVDGAGRVRVIDFGVALAVGLERLTQTGAMVGTPQFMAPEQIQGQRDRFGPPTDVWALGVLLYELITGTLPFPGDTYQQLVTMICCEKPKRPSSIAPDVPKALEAICLRALAQDPADRYENGEEMALALDGYLVADVTQGSWRPWAWSLGVGLLLAVALARPWASPKTPELPLDPTPTETEPAAVAEVAAVVSEEALPHPDFVLPPRLTGPENVRFRSQPFVRDFVAKADDQGEVPAMITLGSLALSPGLQDEAAYWFRTAARMGSAKGMRELGGLLVKTGEVAEGCRWLDRAVVAGEVRAARALEHLIESGTVPATPQRLQQLAKTLREAAARGEPDSFEPLYALMTKGRIPAGPDELQRLLRTAAEHGSGWGGLRLGLDLIARGDAEGMKWLEKISKAGISRSDQARASLGRVLLEGTIVPRDLPRARDLLERSRNPQLPYMPYLLAVMRRRGQGGPVDSAGALSLLRAFSRRPPSEYTAVGAVELGEMLAAGEGCAPDPVEALACFRVSAEAGNAWGMSQLTLALHESGDPAEAAEWLGRIVAGVEARPVVGERLQTLLVTLRERGVGDEALQARLGRLLETIRVD
jgi:TPR repeat protein